MKRFLLFAVACTLIALGLAYVLTQPVTQSPMRHSPYARVATIAANARADHSVRRDICQSWYANQVAYGVSRKVASYYNRAWGCVRVNGVWQRATGRCSLLAYNLQRRDLFTFVRVGVQRCVIYPDGHWATE